MSQLMEFKTEEVECPVAKKNGLIFGLGIGVTFIGIAEGAILAVIVGAAVSAFALYNYLKFIKK